MNQGVHEENGGNQLPSSSERVPVVRRSSSSSSHFDELRQLMSTADCTYADGAVGPILLGQQPAQNESDSRKRDSRAELSRTWSSKMRLRSREEEAYQPRQHDILTSRQLERRAVQGVEFLEKLQLLVASKRKLTVAPVMPTTALHFSKGLVFMWQHKAGLIGSYSWATGFIISRVGGHRQWSAPCFFKDRCFSLGLTAGFVSKEVCLALPTEAGVNIMAEDLPKTDIDVNITLFIQDPLQIDVPQALIKAPSHLSNKLEKKAHPKVYQLGDGFIADISWTWGRHRIDTDLNTTVYGPDVSATSILEGHVRPPAEFKPFYEALGLVTAAAPVVRKSESLFYLAKELRKSNSLSPQRGSSSSSTTVRDRISMDGTFSLERTSEITSVSTVGSMDASSPSGIGGCSKLFPDVPEIALEV